MAEHLKTLLKKTAVSEDLLGVDLKWMENVEPMKDFLKWIENSISSRNCLTPHEIITHRTLSEHDKLLEDEVLESTFQKDFPGPLSVISYDLEVKLLENVLIETQKRLEILNSSHKEIFENNSQHNHQNVLLCKANKLLEEEAKRTRAVVAGEYRKALQNLAASNANLSSKLRSIANNGSPPGTIGFTELDHICGLVEDLKMCISLCTDHFQEEMEKENAQDNASHGEFDTSNLSRLFNDSIQAEILSVELMANIQGLSAALDHLRNDSSTSLELPRSLQSEELHSKVVSVCHEKMMVSMKRKQLDHATQKRLRKERLKPKMDKAVELAKRMKLIGDAIISIAKEERLWVLTCRNMLNETVQVLEEEYEDVHKCMDNIQKTRTMLDLSVSNHSVIVPTANTSFIGGLLMNRRGLNNSTIVPPVSTACSIQDLADPVLSKLKSFEEQARNALVCSKTFYNGLFRGPSATPPSLQDYVSTVLRIKEDMEQTEKKWNELHCLQAVASPADPIHLLLERLSLMYLRDPEDFFMVVNRMEEEQKLLKMPSFCQTQEISLLDESA